jgi:hypothetical protein
MNFQTNYIHLNESMLLYATLYIGHFSSTQIAMFSFMKLYLEVPISVY